ncbi:MAG: carboxypeptidase regulatory-like domain-containing protein [Opitutaceae bacterium]|nr:carboxypeptidase regulatory-like domain-containing protein [Opitutaceae bacterium]
MQVKGTAFQTLTDKDGSFRLAGLRAGTYTVVASYAGLDDVTKTVTVTGDQTARSDFELTAGEVYTLGQFVVTSTLEGSAYAVNQQRRAESSRSVTSIDAFIDQTTCNPGEFLKSVEGIQMDYSQNEPQVIRVRGFDPLPTTAILDSNLGTTEKFVVSNTPGSHVDIDEELRAHHRRSARKASSRVS